ncbi:MAG TPA: response regulator transcription factor [Candidatus Dormibacteraeota bacterium]|nr:response regulator transcription factor [Candidatus Dormibacteraeota bacterium]
MQILIAEDDVSVAKVLFRTLTAEHYSVRSALHGQGIPAMIETDPCVLLILDLNLPGVHGLETLRQIRAKRPRLLILVLASSARVKDRVDALNSGADDYLTKPFVLSELLARVRALLRRGSFSFDPVLRTLDLELDRMRHIVLRKGRPIDLSPKEFALLEYLMLNAGSNVTRSAIIHNVWKISSDVLTNVVDVYINYLRKKIDSNSSEKIIRTVRGAGYRIDAGQPQLT